MKICPKCEAGYPDDLMNCPLHGGLLSEIRDLKPGMLVRNTYRIVRKLSKGGMAQVYLAEHVLLDEPQVLKFLSPDLSHDQDWTSRFLREVRALRLIRHRNVVHAESPETAEDGSLFFSMEYIEGSDLLTFRQNAPMPFDVGLALELVHGIAQGLGAAHAVGVVHRDIKPENILLAVEGSSFVPKIADFGIVATQGGSRLTQSGNTLLTPHFAAPEQWLGKKTSELDGRTDFYALGGLLFELLTGQCAFFADNYHDWAQQHIYTPAPRPSTLRTELKDWRGLDDLVLRLLAKDPDDRPASDAQVLRLIEAIVHEPAEQKDAKQETTLPLPASPQRQIEGVLAKPSPQIKIPESKPEILPSVIEASAPAPHPQPARQTQPPAKPFKVWEPFQPRSTTGSRLQEVTSQPGSPLRKWIVAAAVLIVLALLAWRFVFNPVHVIVLRNQKDAIFAVAFAPNGLGLVSASRDSTVQFWNVADERPLGTISATTTSLAFSRDGHALATGMADYSINIWDSGHLSVLGTISGHSGTVTSIAFSPDGQMLASASWDNTVRLWEVSSSRLLRTFIGHTDRVFAIAYSPDGHLLASAGADQAICLWDPLKGTLLRTLRGHTGAVNSLAFSPDGRVLASAGDDHTIKLWDVSSGNLARALEGHSGPVYSVSFSPDGRILASGSADTTVRLWDVLSGRSLRVLKGHSDPVLSVAFSPSDDTVASGSADKTIRLWQVANARQ